VNILRGLLKVTRLPNGCLKPDVRSRWLVFLPVALFALFVPQPAHATQTGLLVRGYQITEIPPTKSDLAYPLCGTSVEPFINATWDGQPYEDCGEDSFMLHYTGFIQIPEHETIEFFIASDDGGTVKIGTEEFGVWQDQGCSATATGQLQIDAGTRDLDAWFYENGGGTCFMLAWNIDDRGWEIIQPEFFTSEPLTPATTSTLETTTTSTTSTTTTSTTSTSTTSTSTTSTIASSTTNSSTTSTSTTTSSTSSTSTTTTTTTIYQPTTTAAPQTTTTSPQTTSSTDPTSLSRGTTTTTLKELDPIPLPIPLPIPEPSTSVQTTEPEPIETTTTQPELVEVVTTDPATTVPTIPSDSTVSLPEPSETSTSVEVTPTTFFSPDEPLTSEQFKEVLTALSEATPEQINEIVDTILNSEITSQQAEQLVASPEILSAVTPEQAQQLFEQVEETQLSESMAAVIAEALNDPSVPDEVKEVFEESINIFGNDGFATYVPTGSAVNVAVRRTIIAGTTILVALPSPVSTRRT
jgi:hypothetical protein